MNRIGVVVLFLALYISGITTYHLPENQINLKVQSSLQKKQTKIIGSHNESLSCSIEVIADNFQNTHETDLKKKSGEHLIFKKSIVSLEKSKFKQYRTSWNNQLIASKKTDQLYPHHTFG
ncbi:MAG: hypothetical protein ACSHXL_00610 [Bacteroidota bacterium]